MKKILTLLLALMLSVLTLSSCSLSIKDLIRDDTDTEIIPGENEFPIVPPSSESKTTNLQLTYVYDHTTLAETGEKLASLLVEYGYLMNGFGSVEIPKDATAGDIIVVKHTGEIQVQESYPSMINLKNGTLKSYSIEYAEVIHLSGDEINAQEIKSNYDLISLNVITDKTGRFVSLDDYQGEDLYLVVDKKKQALNPTANDQPTPIACMLAYNPRAVSK